MSRKRRNEIIESPVKVKTPLEELEILSAFADSDYFVVLNRVARRYADTLKSQAFRLDPLDPNFKTKHTQYFEQAVGMMILLKYVEQAKREYSKRMKEEE